jgi:glycosyltransferase involved in cell wall biosynthesis
LPDIALTICIPTYQRPVLVQRAIRSAIDSSRGWSDSVELIVSDNSPELTSAVCGAALSKWRGPAEYLGNVTNIGLVANLNQCLDRAVGRYVLFLNDDDYLLPGGTGAILAATRTATVRDAALLFGVQVVDGDGQLLWRQCFRDEQSLSPPQALIRVLSDSSFVRMPAIVIRRDVLEGVGGFDPTVGNATDTDLYVRIFSRFGVRCLPATISAYSVHEAAETTRAFTPESVRIARQIFDRAAAMGILPARVVRSYETDFLHQFILAGTRRRLAVGDRRGAEEIMSLFRMAEVRALGFSPRWLLFRWGMHLLMSMPSKVSQPVTGGAVPRIVVGAALGRGLAGSRQRRHITPTGATHGHMHTHV